MEALRKVLQHYSGTPVTMGSRDDETKVTISRDSLQRDLSMISRRNEKYFMVGVVMTLVLFIALIVIAFIQQHDSISAQAVPPILGSSAALVVWRMFKTWREKSYTDCVLALLPNVDDEMLKTIVGVLVTKI
jgi:hypothetical protein